MIILFQGDSITDCGRDREKDVKTGIGYPTMVKGQLGYDEPGHTFINRGIGGNRSVDLYARIKKDIINLKPDLMSILIGVNDVWHDLHESPNGVDADKFYKIYCMLIEEVKEALPNIKIMILEPFVLHGTATDEHWEFFDVETKKRAAMAKKVAEKYNLTWVPLQEGFDALLEKAPAGYWLRDGVHPDAPGHDFIKRQWLKAYASMK
jgi:lysophospholipase L1-like esterase